MTEIQEQIIQAAKNIYSETEIYEHRNQLSLIVPVNKLLEISQLLKESEETSFDMCIDITAIDWLDGDKRFEVVYFLYSNKYKSRVRLKVRLQSKKPECPSVTEIWPSANWYERETYDMYGIKFTGHPNLRRFYMPEDYKDPETGEDIYPLRKDFPLMGVPDSLPLPPYPEKYGEPE